MNTSKHAAQVYWKLIYDLHGKVDNLIKPMRTLCTELHEKGKYCSRNGRYPETNPPPEHIINDTTFQKFSSK